jgi:hypothetical protein
MTSAGRSSRPAIGCCNVDKAGNEADVEDDCEEGKERMAGHAAEEEQA